MAPKRHKLHHPAASSHSLQPQALMSTIPSVRPPPHRVNRVPSQSQDTCNLGKQASCSDSMQSKRSHDPSRGLNLEKHMSYGDINAKISLGRPTDSVAAAIPLHAGSQIVTTRALPTKKRSWKDVENIEELPLCSHLPENSKSNDGPSPIAFFAPTRTRTKRKPRQFCSPADKAKYEKMKEIMERSQDEESFMNRDEIYNEVMDGISKYVEMLGQGSNLANQKLHNINMEAETQELPQNLVVQDECIEVLGGTSKYVKGPGRGPKPTNQKLQNITMDGETQELPQNSAVQDECIEVPNGISKYVKRLRQGSKPKQNLPNILSKRKTQELPQNFVVQDEFIEVRGGRGGKSKYVKELGRGPKPKQTLHNIALERETQEPPQNLVVQDECIEVMDEMSERATRLAKGPKPTKQTLQIMAVGKETEDLPQNLVIQDESCQRGNEEQANQAAEVPTPLAKHLEEMRMRQAQLEQQAKLLEEMLAFEAQLKKQAKRLEEMSTSQAQLRASFQRLLQ